MTGWSGKVWVNWTSQALRNSPSKGDIRPGNKLLSDAFHDGLGAAVADDADFLALGNHFTLGDDIEDFVAELGLAAGPQIGNGHALLSDARGLSLQLRFLGYYAAGALRNQVAIERGPG